MAVARIGQLGQTEISYANLVIRVEHDVRWFQIAMDDPFLMGMLDSLAEMQRQGLATIED